MKCFNPVSLLRAGVFALAGAFLVPGFAAPASADEQAFGGDPYKSHQWLGLRQDFFGAAPVRFDDRVQVRGPAFAEDPMNVPITVSVAPELGDVEQITVLVDRNPIRKVLEFFPVAAAPSVGFRFKLEQGSPVQAQGTALAARTS